MMSHEPRVDAPAVAGTASPRVPFSFEIYPPRTPEQLPALYETIRVLAAAGPRFISVTFGAGGSTTDRSLTVLTHILRETTVPPVAHVTCVGSSYAEATTVIRDFLDAGITRFLALRGDPPAGVGEDDIVVGDLESAAQLVQLIGRVQAERSPYREREIPGLPGAVQVTDGDRVEIAVADRGPGLKPEDAKRIFDRFYRADKSRSRALGGSGLGLPIVQQIVEAHQGTARVETAPGEGCTFLLEIPPAPAEPPPAA